MITLNFYFQAYTSDCSQDNKDKRKTGWERKRESYLFADDIIPCSTIEINDKTSYKVNLQKSFVFPNTSNKC